MGSDLPRLGMENERERPLASTQYRAVACALAAAHP